MSDAVGGDGAPARSRRGISRRTFIGGTAFGAAAATALHAAKHELVDEPMAARAQAPGGPPSGVTRQHWIVARPRRWNVSPTGFDDWRGRRVRRRRFTAVVYEGREPGFGRPLPPRGVGDNTGIPGPVIRANVGDDIVVHFRNEDTHTRRPHTIHPHGVRYPAEFDGTFLGRYTPPGGAVPFGETFTYRWRAAPNSVGVWPYHDHGPFEVESAGGGLFGSIVVTPPEERRPDVEATIYFHVMQPDVTGFDRAVMAINGRSFAGNTPTVRARVGQEVAFNVFGIGSEFHTFHIHGHRWPGRGGEIVDNPTFGPAEGLRARFLEDAVGRWIYHCHVFDHMMEGMLGFYLVEG